MHVYSSLYRHMSACVAFLSLLLVFPVAAQRYDAYSLADSVTIGERFELLVSIEHDGGLDPIFPHDFLPDSLASESIFELGGFTILGNSPIARRQISAGWVIDSLRYEVATFELDSAYVPTMPLGLVSDTDTLIAGTPPVLVRVISLVPEDAEGIRDITDLAGFPGISWVWYVFLVLVVAGLVYWFWKRSRAQDELEEEEIFVEPTEPPWDEAQRRLRLLESLDLVNPANIKPFYVELSELLRTYLSRRVSVPALESTTRELVEKLREALASGVVPPETIKEVENVLSGADLVKFADAKPVSEEGQSALTRTRSVIEEAEQEYNVRKEALLNEELSSADEQKQLTETFEEDA